MKQNIIAQSLTVTEHTNNLNPINSMSHNHINYHIQVLISKLQNSQASG